MADILYTPTKALERVIDNFMVPCVDSLQSTCATVSTHLNQSWSTNYIYKVFTGRIPASKKFNARISQLDYKIRHPQRIWLGINALSMEQKERWKLIPMAKRREALDRAFTDMNYQIIRKGLIK